MSIRRLILMTENNLSDRFVERRLKRGTQTIRELSDDLRVTREQLDFIVDDAQEKEIRAMVAETPDAALEHHQAQRHLEAMRRHHDHLVAKIAEHQIHQDQLLDKLGN